MVDRLSLALFVGVALVFTACSDSEARAPSLAPIKLAGTVDAGSTVGMTSLTFRGAVNQGIEGDGGLVPQTALSFNLMTRDTIGNLLIDTSGSGSGLVVNGSGGANVVLASDIESALNDTAITASLPSQFTVAGSFADGFTVVNTNGNSFTIDGGDSALFLGFNSNSLQNAAFGTSQQPLIRVGDVITFDNFEPQSSAQLLSAVAPGTGNSETQFEIADTADGCAQSLADALGLNSVLNGIVETTVTGNSIELRGRSANSGNFTIATTSLIPGAVVVSAALIDVLLARPGDTVVVSNDGSNVVSHLEGAIDTARFPSQAGNLSGESEIDLRFEIENLAASPLTLTMTEFDFADASAMLQTIIVAMNSHSDIVAAGLDGSFSIRSVNNTTGEFEIENSQAAGMQLSPVAGDEDDFNTIFPAALNSYRNGEKFQFIASGGSADVGFIAVEASADGDVNASNLVQAIDASPFLNNAIDATALFSLVHFRDERTIGTHNLNALAGNTILTATGPIASIVSGTQLVGANAERDRLIREGLDRWTFLDFGQDYIAAGIGIGDEITFSGDNVESITRRIVTVGTWDVGGNTESNVQVIQFEAEPTDNFPYVFQNGAYEIR